MPGEDGGALLRTLSQPSVLPERGMGFQEVESPGQGAHRQAQLSYKCIVTVVVGAVHLKVLKEHVSLPSSFSGCWQDFVSHSLVD